MGEREVSNFLFHLESTEKNAAYLFAILLEFTTLLIKNLLNFCLCFLVS